MPDEAFVQSNEISATQHSLIGTLKDVRISNLENEADKTIPHQNWLSKLSRAMPYYSEIDSGDVLNIKANYNRYAKVYYTLATLECSVKNEWIVALEHDQGYFYQTYLIESENTITGYAIENQPEIYTSIDVDETSVKAEDFYTQNVHNLPDVKAIVKEKLNDSQYFTTVLSKRNIETREQIYKIELQVFKNFPREYFRFSVRCIANKSDIGYYIINKKLLYYVE